MRDRDSAKDRIHDLFTLKLDWKVLEYSNEGNDLAVTKHRDYACLEPLSRRRGLLHIVGMVNRPGVFLFTRKLELLYFPPSTPRNLDFEYRAVLWEGMLWGIVSIPEKTRRFADRLAGRIGLRLADGVPTVFTSENPGVPHFFPPKGKAVWTLEFSDGNSSRLLSRVVEEQLVEDLETGFKNRGRN